MEARPIFTPFIALIAHAREQAQVWLPSRWFMAFNLDKATHTGESLCWCVRAQLPQTIQAASSAS